MDFSLKVYFDNIYILKILIFNYFYSYLFYFIQNAIKIIVVDNKMI